MSNQNENNENKENMSTGHVYDGIAEENNPMPAWWSWTLVIAVGFAFLYYLHYEVSGNGLTLKQELEVSMKQLEELKAKAGNQFPELTEDQLESKIKDPQLITAGMNLYKAKCAMCHGDNLEGKIGPNLTDATWIHGAGKPSDLVGVIRKGVLDKGMPPWEGVIKPDEILSAVAFIKSKKQE